MNKEQIIKIFINELGEPNSLENLNEYLDFLLNYSNENNGYSEDHHILPRSLFKKYYNENWNKVNLLYEDHIYAHELLFQSYINRSFLSPLNFMKSQLSKNHDLISEAAKKGWNNFKKDKPSYNKWRKKRSNYMKSLSKDECSRRSKKAWDDITEYEYNKRCQINKNNWTEERKQIKSKQMKDYFKNNPDEMTERSKKMWSSMSSEKRKEFKDKMNIVNNDLNKRNKASKSIKEKWKDPSFKNKMKNRKTSSREVIAISPFGEIIKRDGIIEILEEFDFNIRLMHQFRNTNKPVESKNVKNKKNISNTIGWKFYYKRYGKTNIS